MHKVRTRGKTGYNEYDHHKLKRKAIKNLKKSQKLLIMKFIVQIKSKLNVA